MATTPNVPLEQGNKANLRGVTRGGANAYYEGIDPAILVNAAATLSGVLNLSIGTANTSFVISGSNGSNTTVLTGTSTGNNVNQLVAALAAGPLNGVNFFVNNGGANYLYDTTTTIIVPSGAVLTVVSATGTAPTITAVAITGTNGEAVTYPNYVGAPNAAPTWIDDATVHTYQVGYAGQYTGGTLLNGSGTLVQAQVRQIQTNVSETQQYAGYQATYSGNLFQTAQKRTYRQQC